jgi:hypothetical protein
MSETGEAKAKEDIVASGAKPRLEERVREQGWRPTNEAVGVAEGGMSAARRRALAAADTPLQPWRVWYKEAAA